MIYYIDLFCGAGGVTTGIVRAGGKVLACINHDPIAIASHYDNHKNVLHFTEDIKTFNVHKLGRMVRDIREHDPNAIICLWASLECTHFSKAKGGGSRDADSRTLAEHLYRYITAIDSEYIDIENVVEFLSWGPLRIACEKSHADRSDLKLRKDGEYHWSPESKKNGTDYRRWMQHICDEYGYEYEYRILNAADFGARTSRVRYFGQFKKPHLPFTWPESTHAKDPSKSNGGLFGKKVRKWLAVRPALNLEDKGKSIFGRKKPLSENTLKRLYAGLIKHVGEGKEPEFISKYLSNPKGGVSNPVGLDEAAPTITTQNRLAIVQPEFIMKYFSGRPDGKVKSTDEPLGSITSFGGGALAQVELLLEHYSNGRVDNLDKTIGTLMTKDKHSLVFLSKYFSGDQHHSHSADEPAGTITTKDHHAVVIPEAFIAKYHGNGDNTKGIDVPSGAVTAADVMSIIFLDKQYGGTANHQDVDRPSGSILPNDKHCKVEAILINNYSNGGESGSIDNAAGSILTVPKQNLASLDSWLMNHNYSNIGSKIDKPSPTLLASRKHYYPVNPQYDSKGRDIDNPCFTLIARMDKMPPSLVETESIEGYGIILYDDDSEYTKKIKLFMAAYGISDVKMRMLRVPELLNIQGFGSRYKLRGTQTDQKRFIGNSVPPKLVKSMVLTRTRLLKDYTRPAVAA
jgi:DNA (cytosine-5)-methyltransferase 1